MIITPRVNVQNKILNKERRKKKEEEISWLEAPACGLV